MTLLVFASVAASVAASVSAAPVVGVPSLRRRLARSLMRVLVALTARLLGLLARARKRAAERARLRLAAALLDLGHHLMLCDEERRSRRVRSCIDRALQRGRDPMRVLGRFGGSWTDEVTFEVPIGSRAQEGNPTRTLRLTCAITRPPDDEFGGEGREPAVSWRVTNRPSAGIPGPISYSEVPDLERALISYHAPVLAGPGSAPAAGGRFFDEGVHDPVKPAA